MKLFSQHMSAESPSRDYEKPKAPDFAGLIEKLGRDVFKPFKDLLGIGTIAGSNGQPGIFQSVLNYITSFTNGLTGNTQDKQSTNESIKGGFSHPLLGKGVFFSPFGPRNGTAHQGVDLAAAIGTKVGAWAGGKVSYAQFNNYGYGNLVIVDHPDGRKTYYAHLQSMNVKVGQTVQPGQQLGLVGSTGHSSGPHLHFEIRSKNGAPMNPEHVCKNECQIDLRKRMA